jgi:error-prone DNA polymerase
VFKQNRRIVMTSRFVAVRGRLQKAGLVVHVVAQSFVDLTAELGRLTDGDLAVADAQGELPLGKSRDFH